MKSLSLILSLLLLFGFCQANDERPNFVLVLAHDLGRDWISCYGAEHQTPQLDELASEGIRFETAWSMPDGELSHRTLLSGRYPCFPTDQQPSFVQVLIEAGYTRADYDFDREFQLPAKRPFLLLCQLPRPTGDFSEYVTKTDEMVGTLVDQVDDENTLFLFTSDNGSAQGGKLKGESYPAGKGVKADRGAHVPFIIKAPFLSDGGRVCRDLVDFTDLYPTLLELAEIKPASITILDGKSLVPSLGGGDDPFEKRNWIFSMQGDFRMIRDWHHILDSDGNFHDLNKDPLQEQKVSVQDKQAPHREERLQMILDRIAQKGKAPQPQ